MPKDKTASHIDDSVTQALDRFKSPALIAQWGKALGRRDTDPTGALTTARELLESVCKHILEEAQIPYEDDWDLSNLYNKTAETLQIAPNQQTEDDFRKIMGACSTIVQRVGNLRTDLGDAHGKGKDAAEVAARHAELAVNLAGVLMTYLIKTWEGHQRTVGEVISHYMAEVKHVGITRRYALNAMLASPLARVIASRLTKQDIIDYCKQRQKKVKPQTVRMDLSFLANAFEFAKLTLGLEGPLAALQQGRAYLKEHSLTGQTKQRRDQRVSAEEMEKLLASLRLSDGHQRSEIKLAVLAEFAVEAARHMGEICALLWEDYDPGQRICFVRNLYNPGTKKREKRRFELSDRAIDLIEAQKPATHPRIFPWSAESAKKRFTLKKGEIGLGHINFRDLRYESLVRLFEKGHPPHQVAKITGIKDPVDLSKLFNQYGKSSPEPVSLRAAAEGSTARG